PFGRCGRPVGEELLDLEAQVRERFLEHSDETDDIVAAADFGARRGELRIGGPRVGVAATAVERVDVPEDHVSGVGHLLSDCRWECHRLRSETFTSDEKQCRRQASLRNWPNQRYGHLIPCASLRPVIFLRSARMAAWRFDGWTTSASWWNRLMPLSPFSPSWASNSKGEP